MVADVSEVSTAPVAETAMKAWTVVGLCRNRTRVSYSTLLEATGIATVKELESLLIHHCMYPGLISGKLDQKLQQLHVYKSAPQKVSPEKFDRMISSLGAWLDQAHKVGYFLDGMGRSLEEATEKAQVAAQAKMIALAQAKKDRMERMERMKEDGKGMGKAEEGGVPTKSDMKASVKKPKRKKRAVDADAEDDVGGVGDVGEGRGTESGGDDK